jgi:hypothetical protein
MLILMKLLIIFSTLKKEEKGYFHLMHLQKS